MILSSTKEFKLVVYEGDNPKALFYTWGLEVKRLGINLMWFQAGFTLAEEK